VLGALVVFTEGGLVREVYRGAALGTIVLGVLWVGCFACLVLYLFYSILTG
jgi:hypothetical protein